MTRTAVKASRKPRTLYVHRPLLNGADLLAWAKAAGFSKAVEPSALHVTLAYSKAPLVWPEPEREEIVIPAAATGRKIARLGDKGATVLHFDSAALERRWKGFLIDGASWDYAGYKPHVTLSYDAADLNPKSVNPYTGPLHFGGEIFAALDEDFEAKENTL